MGGQVSHRRTPAQSVADTPEQIKQWAKEQILAVGKLDSRLAPERNSTSKPKR